MEVIRGHILLTNRRIDEAEQVFKDVIIQSSNAPMTMLRIMVSLYDNRYVSASYKLFKKFFTFVDSDWKDGYAYMALCCWDLQKDKEFLRYLQMAVEKNPKEARLVLGHLFPEGMKPSDYLNYITEKMNRQ